MGIMLGCKYGIGLMKISGGSIINIFFCSGIVGILGVVVYVLSKVVVCNYIKSVVLYCVEKGYGICCNSIYLAVIMILMWDVMFGEGE